MSEERKQNNQISSKNEEASTVSEDKPQIIEKHIIEETEKFDENTYKKRGLFKKINTEPKRTKIKAGSVRYRRGISFLRYIFILLGIGLVIGSFVGASYIQMNYSTSFYNSRYFASWAHRTVDIAADIIAAERVEHKTEQTSEEKEPEGQIAGQKATQEEELNQNTEPKDIINNIDPNTFRDEIMIHNINSIGSSSNVAVYVENKTDNEIIASTGFYDAYGKNASILKERYPKYGRIKISSERGLEVSETISYVDFSYALNLLSASQKEYEIYIVGIKDPINFTQYDEIRNSYDSYQTDRMLGYSLCAAAALVGLVLLFANITGLRRDRLITEGITSRAEHHTVQEAKRREDSAFGQQIATGGAVETTLKKDRSKIADKRIPKEVTDKWASGTVNTLNSTSRVLQHVKLEFKVVALLILYTQFFTAWDRFFYSNYTHSLMGRSFIAMMIAIVVGVALIYDFIKSDKEAYIKNSYYNELKNRKARFPKTKKGGTMSSFALNMYSSFDLIFILGGVVLLSLLFALLSSNIELYLIVSALGGTAILAQAFTIRRKMVDERLTYMDEIAAATQDIVDGKMYTVVPEKQDFPMSELAHNINLMREGYGTALQEQLKSERMKTELIANVSHDLKTPLTSIINYVDLLKKETLLPEYARDYVMILDQKSQRLNALIQDLFQVSRAASGDIEVKIEELDIAQLLRQTLAELSGRIEASKLNFITNIPENEVFAKADGEKLHRVFENLITNILKYSLEGTRVYIDMEVHRSPNISENTAQSDAAEKEATSKMKYVDLSANSIKITMRNISSYEMNFSDEEIIQRFNRADKARTTEGSGLGLAICKSFLDLMSMDMKISTDGDLFKAEIRINR